MRVTDSLEPALIDEEGQDDGEGGDEDHEPQRLVFEDRDVGAFERLRLWHDLCKPEREW